MHTPAPQEQSIQPLHEQELYRLTVLGGTIGGAILGMGGVYALGVAGENQANAKDLRMAAGYERCASFVQSELQPGDTTITIKLSELNKQWRDDCGVAVPRRHPDGKNIDPDAAPTHRWNDNAIYTAYDATRKEVTLPTVEEYDAAAADRNKRAGFNKLQVYGLTPTGAPIGAFMGGVLGLMYFKRRQPQVD